MEPPKLLTITQAARILRVHPHTLRSWADKGLVPVIKTPSGYRRFDPSSLAQWMVEQGYESIPKLPTENT